MTLASYPFVHAPFSICLCSFPPWKNVVQNWLTQNGLRSDLRAFNFNFFFLGGMPPDPPSMFVLTHTWPYHSIVACSGPETWCNFIPTLVDLWSLAQPLNWQLFQIHDIHVITRSRSVDLEPTTLGHNPTSTLQWCIKPSLLQHRLPTDPALNDSTWTPLRTNGFVAQINRKSIFCFNTILPRQVNNELHNTFDLVTNVAVPGRIQHFSVHNLIECLVDYHPFL